MAERNKGYFRPPTGYNENQRLDFRNTYNTLFLMASRLYGGQVETQTPAGLVIGNERDNLLYLFNNWSTRLPGGASYLGPEINSTDPEFNRYYYFTSRAVDSALQRTGVDPKLLIRLKRLQTRERELAKDISRPHFDLVEARNLANIKKQEIPPDLDAQIAATEHLSAVNDRDRRAMRCFEMIHELSFPALVLLITEGSATLEELWT